MSLRLLLLAAVIYFASPIAIAKSTENQTEPANESVVEGENQPEDVTLRRGLAAHMGLTSQEVVFGKPRNFRSESLNNFALDPITDEEQ